jgi:methylated-DNA-[protein]-cysteine S-methyltransferase
MQWASVPSPIGLLGVAADGIGVAAVRFGGPAGHPESGPAPLLQAAREQLDEYFAGRRTDFTLPLAPPGGTGFEQAVWAQITAIPYGETATYGTVAARVGQADAARAVGVACNRNPLPILVPCHRVVGAGGKLVGFGGGLPRKRFLLELEARVWIEREFRGGSAR